MHFEYLDLTHWMLLWLVFAQCLLGLHLIWSGHRFFTLLETRWAQLQSILLAMLKHQEMRATCKPIVGDDDWKVSSPGSDRLRAK